MVGRSFEGSSGVDAVSAIRLREDLRPFRQKLREFWLTPFGQQVTFLVISTLGLLLIWAPLGGELLLLLALAFSRVQTRYKNLKWDFPFRVPQSAGLIDGSTNRKGAGIFYLGNEIDGNKLPVVISDNDARTHGLIFGTTGSGKTELLLGFVVNSLVYDGGSSYTDGKGDVKLWMKYMNAARMFGRTEDLLLISFITSGKEFYDRQELLPSNTLNPYATGSSGMCTEASISLMDSGSGGDDMWKGRAIAFLGGLIKPLVFLRDKGEILLGADVVRGYFDLPVLERFVYDKEDVWNGGLKREEGYFAKKYGRLWDVVIRPLKAFMVTIPGYDVSRIGKQEQKTLEQHGYITMQLARLFGDIADNYGHIMDTPLGQVDMYDVVINNRILVTLLPALERSPASLGMLGKIIVGGIKQMAAGCLGNRVEGLRREIVDSRPTNAPVPFPTIFDEYGYYAVLGFSSMPAQARSLGFMVIFAAQDFASLKKSSAEEADQTWENTNLRGIGRITSGSGAETFQRMSELGGNVDIFRVSGYERYMGLFGPKTRASESIVIHNEPRVKSDDLHSQADGEFHLFLGKKEDEASKGLVKVARVHAFYTDVKPVPKNPKKPQELDRRMQPQVALLALNHFGRVMPPDRIQDDSQDTGLYGPRGLLAHMREGTVFHLIKQGESLSADISEIEQISALNASLGDKRCSKVDEAIFALQVVRHGKVERQNLLEDMRQTMKSLSLLAKGAVATGGSGGAVAGGGPVNKPQPVSTEQVSLHEELSKSDTIKVVVPVTPNTSQEVSALIEQAKGAGFTVRPPETEEATIAAKQDGVLQMEVEALKDRQRIEKAIVEVTPGTVSQAERERIAKHTYVMKESLDHSTSYIDDPTPARTMVKHADDVVTELSQALSNPDASWMDQDMLGA